MDRPKYKIGYAESGGIFVGKNIQSDLHQHHSIAIVLSFTEPFEIFLENTHSNTYEGALIPKDTLYQLSTSESDYTVFIHLDPYSELGLKLPQKRRDIKSLNRDNFSQTLEHVKAWLEGTSNTSQCINHLLRQVVAVVNTTSFTSIEIDRRVLESIRHIKQSDPNTIELQQIAELVFLSPSRLSHLFKLETGLTFRQFVRHRKLVRSLQAMHDQQDLTAASFTGGFSDQAHFSKTFKKAFGIKPSTTKQ